jgi:hypothetical protein
MAVGRACSDPLLSALLFPYLLKLAGQFIKLVYDPLVACFAVLPLQLIHPFSCLFFAGHGYGISPGYDGAELPLTSRKKHPSYRSPL